MSTTSLKLPEQLKERVSAIAEQSQTSPHAWMIQAIEAQVSEAELEQEFEELVEARWVRFKKTGKSVSMETMDKYLDDLIAGKNPKPPKATVWSK
jgi:predicted transcriptional regulator